LIAVGAHFPDGFGTGRHAIGIDVGGTKIAGALVNLDTGAIAARRQVPTDCRRGGEPVLDDVIAMARDLIADGAGGDVVPQSLGVGVAELVNPQGEVFSDYRIRWKGIDVKARLAEMLPTVVSSDVRAAALAEARFGAGRGLSDFYFVTIGTGVSGVLVRDGEPYAGSRGAALVIANGPTRHHCPSCGHVATKIVEDIASGPGLVAAFGLGRTGEDVLMAAQGGDPLAVRVVDHATYELGRVLSLLVNSLDPAAVIIGGGLGSAPGLYFDSLARHINAGLWDGDQHVLPILQATFGPDAGIIGAAAATILHQEPVHRPVT
jgi:glucokinase